MSIDELTTQLLAHMGIEGATVEVKEEDERVVITIRASEDDSGILIGRHGETVDALQKILRLFLKDSVKPVSVNINDFRERREEHLKEVALAVAARVSETGVPQTLHLPASERRIIHMALAENSEVETQSQGDGDQRVLVVSPKTA